MATTLKEYVRESIKKYLSVIKSQFYTKSESDSRYLQNGGQHDVVSENLRVIVNNYTIPDEMNALSVEPTIATGVVLTLGTDTVYVII